MPSAAQLCAANPIALSMRERESLMRSPAQRSGAEPSAAQHSAANTLPIFNGG